MSIFLKTKRLVGALICVIVTVLGFSSYFSGVRYLSAAAAVERTLAVEMAIEGALSSLKDGETGERGYVITGDEHFLQPYHSEQQQISGTVARLKQAVRATQVQRQRVELLEHLIVEKHALMDETIETRREGDVSTALALVSDGRGKAIMDQIRSLSGQLRDEEQRALLVSKEEARRAQAAAAWAGSIALLLTLLLAFVSLLTVHRDVRELKRTSEELAASERHFRLLTEHGSDLVRLVNLQGGASYVSPSVERLLGYGVDEFLALPPLALLHPDELLSARQFLVDVEHGASPPGLLTYRLRRKSGEYGLFETRWMARRDAAGAVAELHTVSRDVTERKRVEDELNALAAELRSLSLRDELTGLYNRRGFSEMAGQVRSLAARDGRPAALIFVDLNGMKRINDQFGHEVGDAALLDAARVLIAAHQQADVVARLGGDEFAVFSLDFTACDLDPLRQRLRALADSEATCRGRSFRLSMSTGAAFMEAGSRETLVELLDRADAAMYAQKQARATAGGVSMIPPSRIGPLDPLAPWLRGS